MFNRSLYVNGSSGRIVNGNSGQEHYSRIPDSVLEDKKCSASARCVYAFLAGRAFQGSTARVGQRRIATRLGFHQETVGRALQKLEARGHISVFGHGRARRAYHLNSNVFGTKQRAG